MATWKEIIDKLFERHEVMLERIRFIKSVPDRTIKTVEDDE